MPDGSADAAVRPDVRALAVDDERELLAGNEAADAEVLNRELVFAVGRKVVTRDDAAARAEGHALEALVLRGVARRQIGGLGRRLPVADRHAGDARRRGRVRLEQRRRDRQRPGDVVEAVGRVVGRQQRRDVDLAGRADREWRWRTPSGSADAGRPTPGSARAAAARSISASSQSRSPSYSASGGRGTSGGGITPARSLRITFSHSSA